MGLIRREPAMFYTMAMGLVVSVLTALPAFGVTMSDDQLGAAGSVLSAVLVLALSLITGTVIRSQVTPANQVMWQAMPSGGIAEGAALRTDPDPVPQNAYDDDRDGDPDYKPGT